MRRLVVIAIFVITIPSFGATRANQFRANAASIPSLTVAGDDGNMALALAAVDVHVLVRGHLARSTFELTFRSALDQDAGGTFSFPLPADAEVSDLGLYFNGHLRHAAAIERVQARTAYEETVHRRVDPALAEWTSGRAFRFDVYPIPKQGTKVVHFAYDQELTSSPYTLDLRWGRVENASITIDSDATPVVDGPVKIENAPLATTIRIARNENDESALVAWSQDDKLWYASAAMRIAGFAAEQGPSSHVTLLWDASGSAVQRDDARLREFLDAFLAQQSPNVQVSIVPFHVGVDAARDVAANEVMTTLASIPNAGATNFTALFDALPQIDAGSRIVLITDGVESLTETSRVREAASRLGRLHRPITVVNASSSPDDAMLGSIARATGGWYLDLTKIEPRVAVDAAMHRPARIAFSSGYPMVRDILPTTLVTSADELVTVNARSAERILALPVIAGMRRRDLVVRDAGPEAGDMIRRAWARARLRALLDSGTPDAVLEHGRHFNQLTPRTSLLVLDSWHDYEMYHVPMPPDVIAQRNAELEEMRQEEARRNLPSLVIVSGKSAEGPAAWFAKGRVIVADGTPLPGVTITLTTEQGARYAVTDAEGRFWVTAEKAPKSATIRAELEGFAPATRSFPNQPPNGMVVDILMRLTAVSESITVTASAPVTESDNSNIDDRRATSLVAPSKEALADRLLSALVNDAPIEDDEAAVAQTIEKRIATAEQVVEKLRTLQSIDDRLRYYLAARSVLGGDKLFHANAAAAIHELSPELGIRIMTDLAEAYPDDAPTLRIIGRVLDGWGRSDLARPLFQRSIEIAPRQPQSWRELMLLEAREGHPDELNALHTRFKVAEKDWRLDEINEILEHELARTTRDRRLDPAAPLQIELMFDSNYAFVDLHVIEPGGEEVTWDHDHGASGSAMIGWTAEGFGPEIYFSGSRPGTYKIDLQYYSGDTTEPGFETLAHVVVYNRGERRDFFTALARPNERKTLATIDVR